ncbi:MAG: glycogen/starch synthase, partial [Burkholderiales bacterium]|nr:glycogen/starch synthase [Burkholderiales bacterium]
MKTPSILFATSEMAPWVKTGGLGDVAAALPAALHHAGHDIRVLLPFYPALRKAFPKAEVIAELPALAPALPPSRLLAADATAFSLQAHTPLTLSPRGRGCPEGAGEGERPQCLRAPPAPHP